MRKTFLLILAIIILSLVFLYGNFSVWATIYRIIDTEGNTIRVTTEPQMKLSEEEAGCTISPIQPAIVPLVPQDNYVVEGSVFKDKNANGIKDIGEEGLSNKYYFARPFGGWNSRGDRPDLYPKWPS